MVLFPEFCVMCLYNLDCRQEQFEQSAAGRAAKAQLAAAAKQNANTNKGEPVLKVLVSYCVSIA